jgi:CRISPR-associated protein Cas1
MSDEELWSVRNVAEYAYCPRLFYLMEVEGIHLANTDTEEGISVHKRVDEPSQIKEDSDDPDKPKTLRSLTLSSPALRLTATLDLAEIEGNKAVPVEYRRGRPFHQSLRDPDDDLDLADNPSLPQPEPWPTDRVQLGLQAILLEEAGYQVEEGILYYAAEKRRLRVIIDEALRKEALDLLNTAMTVSEANRPLPLVNDPKCPRCSLQPICLPDEVHYQRREKEDESLSPRKIWPPRDDGIHIVGQLQGCRVGIKGMCLALHDKNGSLVKEIPIAGIDSFSILGSIQISTQALNALAENDVPVAFLSGAGRLISIVEPMDVVSALVRREQVHAFDQPAMCLELARALITAKITNQRTLIMRNHADLPGAVASDLAELIEKAKTAASLDSLRGYEGQAAAIYFQYFAGMIKSEVAGEFQANGRMRRPSPDPINACLSFAYTMLTHECVAALRLARLEPTIGAFHVSKRARPALALDLMEPFRPLIGDSIAIAAFNRGELVPGHFQRTAAGCLMTDHGRRAFFKAYGRRMDTEVTHPVFDYRLSYRRMIHLHARMIAAWILKEIPTLSFLTTR